MRAIALALVVLAGAGCASLRPAPIENATLTRVGHLAVRAAQVANALDIAQQQIRPLVDAEVLTAAEGLAVAKAIGVALAQGEALVTALRLADAATVIGEQLQRLAEARDAIKALLKTVGNLGVGVAGFAGRIVVGGLAGPVLDAVGELLPGGAQ